MRKVLRTTKNKNKSYDRNPYGRVSRTKIRRTQEVDICSQITKII